ncbi:MAG: hypothetical protein Q9181_005354, partial [Wetmoreana brouardii]
TKGHLASDYPDEPVDDELGWFISDEQSAMRFDESSDASQLLCQRCRDLELVSWLQTDPPLQHDQDIREMIDDPRLFRNLGQVRSIMLRDDCGLCRCLFGLTGLPSSLDQEVKLVLSWSMFRLEASMLVDTASKRASYKYITAVLDPSATRLLTDDLVSTRSDGLCIQGAHPGCLGKALCGKHLEPDRLDIQSIKRWISTCEDLHPVTCNPQIFEGLESMCLIDAKSRCIVRYSSQTSTYLALSYGWGDALQDIPGSGRPGTELGVLPRTIEDALALVKDLRQRYLWVDSICIDQKNEAQKLQQIGIMSAVYQSAYATIIAFSGDSSEAGLPRTLDDSLSSVHQEAHDEEYFRHENRFQKVNTGVLRSPLAANMDLQENALEFKGNQEKKPSPNVAGSAGEDQYGPENQKDQRDPIIHIVGHSISPFGNAHLTVQRSYTTNLPKTWGNKSDHNFPWTLFRSHTI